MKIQTRTVYTSTNGRSYLTMISAAKACARAKIRDKYPDEKPEYESGHMIYPGFHWEMMDGADVIYRRLTRLYLAKYRQMKAANHQPQ